MHYVKIKTRVKIYMHDTDENQRAEVFKLLSDRNINYRYIKCQTCISLQLKHEAIAKYITQFMSK
mgnify:CR=1 FL=1